MEMRSVLGFLIIYTAEYLFKKTKELFSFQVKFAMEIIQTNIYP